MNIQIVANAIQKVVLMMRGVTEPPECLRRLLSVAFPVDLRKAAHVVETQ